MLLDFLSEKIAVIIIFLLAYLLLFLFYKRKALIIWSSILLLLLIGVFSFKEAFAFINWNVMGIFIGTLIVSEFFIYSNMPAYLATYFVNKTKSTAMAMLTVCIITGIISAFVENVATVLIMAPIAIAISKKIKLNPIPFLIGIAISSNLQGVATLVGDPPSMLLASFAKLTFNDFIWFMGKPGLFFAVQIGALVSFVYLYYLFRKERKNVQIQEEKVKNYFPTYLLTLMIIALAFASSFDPDFIWVAGMICMSAAVVGIVWYIFKKNMPKTSLLAKNFDYETTVFLMGIFVLVGALTESGVIDDISTFIAGFTGGNVFLTFNVIIWMSVLFSGFVDNVPYVLTMLPVANSLAISSGISPYLYLFALLIGASVGGNITPVGASANIVATGILKKEGYDVKFWDFVKIGLPFTIVTVASSCLFVWVVWG